MTAASISTEEVLTPAMRDLVAEHGVGYVATVNADGTPHVAPRGSFAPWGLDQLVFLEVRKRTTLANLLERPAVAITVVDDATRLGYRFAGEATVVTEGPLFDDVCCTMLVTQLHHCVGAVVSVAVHTAEPLVLTAYGERSSDPAVQRCYEARRLRLAT